VKLAAIVLAAGEGRRMGATPKALVRLGGVSFLEHCLDRLCAAPIDHAFVVLGSHADEVRAESRLPENASFVQNPDWQSGMLSSLLAGLLAAEQWGATAVLVHPVDHPEVASSTVVRVAAALRAGAVIAVPSFEGRRGHPAGFAAEAWSALRAASPGTGAREVLRTHPEWVVHVAGDAGCVTGFNTPEELAAWGTPEPG
jgi:molybdenum cofactor cytidylyltransferase